MHRRSVLSDSGKMGQFKERCGVGEQIRRNSIFSKIYIYKRYIRARWRNRKS